jgi:hypothetical protein
MTRQYGKDVIHFLISVAAINIPATDASYVNVLHFNAGFP